MHPTNKRICARGSEWLTPATPAPRRLKDDWFQASLGYTVRQRPNQLKIKKKNKSTTNDKADKGKKKKKKALLLAWMVDCSDTVQTGEWDL